MHQREVAAIAGGVQGRGGFGDVLADDGDVADLAVAEAKSVMGEADGAGIVGHLGLLQGAAVQRDGARLLAAGEGDAAVQRATDSREGRGDRFREARRGSGRAWCRPAQDRPASDAGLSQHDADRQLVFAR